jgi:hypothetical protein
MMTAYLANMIWSSLHSLAGLVIGSLGWGGLVALAAGTLLLLASMNKAWKFCSSPRGMAAAAAVMLAGLAFMWWTWGKPAPASARSPTTLATQTKQPKLALAELRPKTEPLPLQAVAVAPEPPLMAARAAPVMPPMTGVVQALAGVVLALPQPTTRRLPPLIVPLSRHNAPPHSKAGTSTHTVTTQRGSGPGAATAPAGRPGNIGGGGSTLTAAPRARQAPAIPNRPRNPPMDPMFNPWMTGPGPMGGGRGMGSYPMGGMNHMGGGRR